ncbi:hypothetical protein [Desulfovibrio gilichinskyi]|uniref:Uncharacterized protein n=1 Tax=Desulfovibrio gilichinskyi TaxID=1519643 RepID=A0A1X7CU37_9BACT|nr:hypothetical protein [Desulfovibrio gilichinskyi]SMF03213.1 hypothetical protein SAMN06295933_1271 [Desulfovibrio gilichinskyi]
MKIFVRERVKATDGDKSPRFRVVGVTGGELTIKVKRIRKCELKQLAEHTGAEIVYLTRDGEGNEGKREAA